VPRKLHGNCGGDVSAGLGDLRAENGLSTEFRSENVDDAEAQLGVLRAVRLAILVRRHVAALWRQHARMMVMMMVAKAQSQRVGIHHESYAHLLCQSVLVRSDETEGRHCFLAVNKTTHAFSLIPLSANAFVAFAFAQRPAVMDVDLQIARFT